MTWHYAHVDLRPNYEYFITTYSMDGLIGILDGPPVVLAPGSAAREIGAETLAALVRSTTIISPLKTGGPPPDQELLARAGAKTYGAYMKGTKSVQVFADYEDDALDEIELTPYDNLGRDGFVEMTDNTITLRYSTHEELGTLVIATLEAATAFTE